MFNIFIWIIKKWLKWILIINIFRFNELFVKATSYLFFQVNPQKYFLKWRKTNTHRINTLNITHGEYDNTVCRRQIDIQQRVFNQHSNNLKYTPESRLSFVIVIDIISLLSFSQLIEDICYRLCYCTWVTQCTDEDIPKNSTLEGKLCHRKHIPLQSQKTWSHFPFP